MYLLLLSIGLVPGPYTCITEVHKKISNISGFDFEISETDCSTLGEGASISIFASISGQTKRTLLFKYGPVGTNFKYGPTGVDLMPAITSVDRNTVQISVPRVSDVVFRKDKLEGLTINYDIGAIDYPVKDAEKNKR
jgi:hypothetical protein